MSRHERNIPEYVFDNLDNLKAEVQKQGYTLKWLSEKCGLSLSILCGMANGTHPPAKDRYSRIAAVLNWEAWQ